MYDRVKSLLDKSIELEKISEKDLAFARKQHSYLDDESFTKGVIKGLVANDFDIYGHAIGLPFDHNEGIYYEINRKIRETRKTFVLTMLPRGTYKSTIYQGGLGGFRFLNRVVYGHPLHAVFLHGNGVKAEENLELCKQFLEDEIFEYLYREDLGGIKISNKQELSFNIAEEIKRKEKHFTAASVFNNFAGRHWGLLFVDDAVDEVNSLSAKITESVISRFFKWMQLNDRSGFFQYLCVGTEYTDDSLWQVLQGNHEYRGKTYGEDKVEIIKIPAYSGDLDGEHTLNFPTCLPEEEIRRLRDDLPADEFNSQYMLQPYARDAGFSMNISLEDYVPLSEDEIDQSILLCDPAISKRHKGSEAVLLCCYVSKNNDLDFHYGWSHPGPGPSMILDQIFHMADMFSIDMFIPENVAFQEFLAQFIEEQMASKGIFFPVVRHQHRENKRLHYRQTLEPFASANKLRINPSLHKLVDQLEGNSSKEDWIDCASFISELKLKVRRTASNQDPERTFYPEEFDGWYRDDKEYDEDSEYEFVANDIIGY